MSKIKWEYINSNLIKGGPDLIRNTLGGYYEATSSADGISYKYEDNTLYASTTRLASHVNSDEIVYSCLYDSSSYEPAFPNVFVPNYKIPCLLIGNLNSFKNDVQWKSYVVGGNYDSASYDGIVTLGAMQDGGFTIEKPYDLFRLKELVSSSYGDYVTTEATYKYTYENALYERKSAQTPENLLPHIYLTKIASDEEIDNLSPYLKEFVYLNDVVDNANYEMKSIFNISEVQAPPVNNSTQNVSNTSADIYNDDQKKYDEYLQLFIGTTVSGNAGALTPVRLQNVIYDETLLNVDGVNFDALPWHAHVSWPEQTSKAGTIAASLTNNNLKGYFLKMIKEHFVDRQDVPRQTFDSTITQLRDISGSISDFSELASQTVGYMDLLPSITSRIQNGTHNRGENFEYITLDKNENQILRNQNNYYRAFLNSRLMSALKDSVDYLHTQYDLNATLSDPATNLETLFSLSQNQTEPEVLGYRVGKISTRSLARQQRNFVYLSNSYLFNSSDLETADGKHHFYDTQIKYNEPYVYQVYQYIAVAGWNYAYSNYQISEKIGTSDSNLNCLRFVDISTGDPVSEIKTDFFTGMTGDWAQLYEKLDKSNPFAGESEVTSKYRYLLQMDIQIEPYIRIYEIPILTKYVSVMDHPAVAPEVIPYQKLDNSQRLGFFCKRESFTEKPFPSVLNEAENTERIRYLNSNSMYGSEKVTQKSTLPRYMEVYRITKKPTSFKDFDGSLIDTVVLSDVESGFAYTTAIVEQQVKTNTKYYYIFRFLNSHRMPGKFSSVIEAELISDDNYKYSIFELYDESLITTKTQINQPSKAFKKLFEVVPNPSHLIINDSNVDYGQPAGTQIDNVTVGDDKLHESIWSKKFKIRLVSKKTGKKLDINIDYTLERE